MMMMYHQRASDAVMWRHPTVALIVSASPFTKAAVLRTFSSTLPFLLLHLPLSESRDTGAEVALNAATHDVIESQQPGSVFGTLRSPVAF